MSDGGGVLFIVTVTVLARGGIIALITWSCVQMAWYHYSERKRAAQPPPAGSIEVSIPGGPLGVVLKRSRWHQPGMRSGTRVLGFALVNGAIGAVQESGVQVGWYLSRIDQIDAEKVGFRATMSILKLRAKQPKVLRFRPPSRWERLQLALSGEIPRRLVSVVFEQKCQLVLPRCLSYCVAPF